LHYDQNITADVDRAIEEGREHFGRLALAKNNLANLNPASSNRPAAQELIDIEEAELDRIAKRIGVSTGELLEMIDERVVRPHWDKRRTVEREVDAASLYADVLAANDRLARATNAKTLAVRELIDAQRAQADAMEAYRTHCAQPLVRA
jgi:4-hydroxy-3-methylbut-2-en-1-yl diphosphate synthase IspG/GcpE